MRVPLPGAQVCPVPQAADVVQVDVIPAHCESFEHALPSRHVPVGRQAAPGSAQSALVVHVTPSVWIPDGGAAVVDPAVVVVGGDVALKEVESLFQPDIQCVARERSMYE